MSYRISHWSLKDISIDGKGALTGTYLADVLEKQISMYYAPDKYERRSEFRLFVHQTCHQLLIVFRVVRLKGVEIVWKSQARLIPDTNFVVPVFLEGIEDPKPVSDTMAAIAFKDQSGEAGVLAWKTHNNLG